MNHCIAVNLWHSVYCSSCATEDYGVILVVLFVVVLHCYIVSIVGLDWIGLD